MVQGFVYLYHEYPLHKPLNMNDYPFVDLRHLLALWYLVLYLKYLNTKQRKILVIILIVSRESTKDVTFNWHLPSHGVSKAVIPLVTPIGLVTESI